jgi:gliding motility-associated-like protein
MVDVIGVTDTVLVDSTGYVNTYSDVVDSIINYYDSTLVGYDTAYIDVLGVVDTNYVTVEEYTYTYSTEIDSLIAVTEDLLNGYDTVIVDLDTTYVPIYITDTLYFDTLFVVIDTSTSYIIVEEYINGVIDSTEIITPLYDVFQTGSDTLYVLLSTDTVVYTVDSLIYGVVDSVENYTPLFEPQWVYDTTYVMMPDTSYIEVIDTIMINYDWILSSVDTLFGTTGVNGGVELCYNPGPGYTTVPGDCNDSNNSVRPNALEICNGFDDNCNGSVDEGLVYADYYFDNDNDGFGAAFFLNTCLSPGIGFITQNGDCDDFNVDLNPAETEVCNLLDDNCDGSIDEGFTTLTYYLDFDGDGYGHGTGMAYCQNPGLSYTLFSGDCDETNVNVYPGAVEVCNQFDDNCNGTLNEGFPSFTFFIDSDLDGYGTPDSSVQYCELIPGLSVNNQDCDDNVNTTYLNATEICNNVDDDCDGQIDEGLTLITVYMDADGDGFGDINQTVQLCGPIVGYVSNADDCDDANANVNPVAAEICDGLDNNCNGAIDDGLVFNDYFVDADNDGFGSGPSSSYCQDPGFGFVLNNNDCDDEDSLVSPIETEVCDSIDNDCSGIVDDNLEYSDYYVDADQDGFGSDNVMSFCADPGDGYVTIDGDCNDEDETINPLAEDICDGIDNNCDGVLDEICGEFLPLGFSPNNDLVSDKYKLYGGIADEITTLQVFNRWGNMVFEQVGKRSEIAWDGYSNKGIGSGEMMPVGYYLVVVTKSNGETLTQSISLWN